MTAARIPETDRAPRAAWVALWILTGMNLVNYIDRYVVPAIAGPLMDSKELHLSGEQTGYLATGFLVVYMLTAPLFGILANRYSRPRLLAFGVFIWCAAATASGFAHSFWQLMATRMVVGIGEAAYGTIAPAMIADHFPEANRGRMLAIFYTAIPVGAAISYKLAGAIEAAYGWSAAFFIVGPPGLLLAILALWLPEAPKRSTERGMTRLRDYAVLRHNSQYVLVVLGYAAYTFAVGGISFWMPHFIAEAHHVANKVATDLIGPITVIGGLVGSLFGGWLADKLLPRWRQSYLWVSAISTLLAVPFAYLAFTLTSLGPTFTACLLIAEILIFMSTGPINTSILSVVSPSARAAAMALSILAIHTLGDVPAPPLIGWIRDHSSIQQAVLIIPWFIAIGGVIWLYAAWRAERRPLPAAEPPA
jgi:MFS family permease